MSGGRYKSSGANNTPLAARPGRLGGGGGGGGSLLNPEYLQGPGGSSNGSSNPDPMSSMMGMGAPPPMMAPPPGPPPGGAPAFKPPPGIVGATESDETKRSKALETIMKFNAEQARKRAATGDIAETSKPPMIGDGSAPASSEAADAAAAAAAEARAERKRKRKSRWGGGETDKTFIPGMPTMMPKGLSREQEEAYLLQLKIEDASRRLRSGDMGIPLNPEERSPSPEPIYSSDGKRLNTREYRKRKELEELRHKSITRMMDINTDYKPPPDYKPPMIKVSDKVMIPQDEYPEINFVGLLIGPRGNTLKSMERDTGAKIIIRGKGSVKEGKVGRKDGQPLPGEDEPLHAYVTAINPEAVQKAVAKIKEVIKQGVDVPEGQNDLRKTQLRELALLNGTLREGDGPRCTNCGAADHKSWQCQDKPNMTNSIVCSTCGGAGHIAKDCVGRRPGMGFDGADAGGKTKMDDEYLSLMAELGEGPPPAPSADKDSKPWQRGGQGPFHRGGAPRPLMGPGHYGGRGGGRGGFHHAPPPPPGEFESGGGGGNWRQKPPNLMGQSVPPPWSQSSRGGWNQPPPPGAQPPPPGHGPPPPRGAPPPVQYPGHGPPPPSGGGGYGLPPPYMGAPPPGAPPAPASSASASSGSGQWSSGSWSGGPPPPPGASGGYGGGYGGWGGQGGPAPVAPPRSGSGGSGSGGLSLSSLVSAPPPPPPPS